MAKHDEPTKLNLADVQGNILTAYGRQGFPKGRFFVLNVRDGAKGRKLLLDLLPEVTSGLRWPSRKDIPTEEVVATRPKVALNFGFTFWGLLALGLSIRSLRGMPEEFMDGMAARAAILGDDFPGDSIDHWDDVWKHDGEADRRVHVLVTLNAQMDAKTGLPVPELEMMYQRIKGMCRQTDGGVVILTGHRGPDPDYQPLSAILNPPPLPGDDYTPTPNEHFGFTDGIGDPVFEGQFPKSTEDYRVVGNGKLGGDGVWRPLATGEFLLGYPDEAQETAGGPMPLSLALNGTFMAYRKLHQNVVAFRQYIDAQAEIYQRMYNVSHDLIARETVMAKIAGRWADGTPLSLAPTWDDLLAFNVRYPMNGERPKALSDFTYHDDPQGLKCPMTSHLRRTNPRDGLDPTDNPSLPRAPNGSVLNNRRRILRRGLPYGTASKDATEEEEHGIVMLNVCASLFRQFEFVQQQWINYGLDFNVGNEVCPLVGAHREGAKFVIPTDPRTGAPPFIAARMPNFVETRGGAYFFIPGMTALRMIAMGVVDPT